MRKTAIKYSTKDIARMKRLLKRGYSYNEVAKKTGSRWQTVAYHFKPGYKEMYKEQSRLWKKNNREKARKYAAE